MSKFYAPLPTMPLLTNSHCLYPPLPPEITHLTDPALDVMFDFRHVKPIAIHPDEFIEAALTEMRVCEVPLLLVVDDEQQIVGLISSEEILGEKTIHLTEEWELRHADIRVDMVMTRIAELKILDIRELQHAKVGNIVATFRAVNQHQLLVAEIDKATDKQLIRGLFSASLISRQLGWDVTSASSNV